MTDWRARLTGNDPFDALSATRVPSVLRSNARLRQVVVQLRKRLPLDLAPLIGVEPFLMAKTVGAFLAARSRSVDSERETDLVALAELALSTEGCLGDGRWGYEFDVQTRWAFYPAGSPNLIATVFCARGFAEASAVADRSAWMEHLHQSARWIERDLLGTEGFIRYVPNSGRLVHNANLLGAALVGASACLKGDSRGVEAALGAAVVSINAQQQSGGWAYGVGPGLGWEDNFHTAYVLDALLHLWLITGDARVEQALERGAEHYQRNFFGPQGEPWFSPDSRYPFDIHSAGTAVDVLSRLASWGVVDDRIALRCFDWASCNLVRPDGETTYARRLRMFTDRRHFVRWGDAHWALGTSSRDLLLRGDRVEFEQLLYRSRED